MPSPCNLSALRVLLVEDSLVNQKLLTLMLSQEGCQITVAENGEEAVQRFEEEPFDVILMDVQMPVMDGLTATRLIRQREAETGKRTLIIAVTAGVARKVCLEAGMDDHLQKPIRPEVLRAALEQVNHVV